MLIQKKVLIDSLMPNENKSIVVTQADWLVANWDRGWVFRVFAKFGFTFGGSRAAAFVRACLSIAANQCV